MEKKSKKNAELFVTFLKIGIFTFGGGYAMIPLIQKELVEKKKWTTNEDILEVIAIAESTPGPIAINAATFVGVKINGIMGALLATLGVVIPSFVIIILISYVLRQFEQNLMVSYVFHGIRVGVLALIAKAMISLGKECPKNPVSYVIMVAAFIAVALIKVNAVYVIIASACIGLITSYIRIKLGGKNV